MPTFFTHESLFLRPDVWGRLSGHVTRDPSGSTHPVGYWAGDPPKPTPDRTLRVVPYTDKDLDYRLWRVVTEDGQKVLSGIPDLDTARELLAWLCPPQE